MDQTVQIQQRLSRYKTYNTPEYKLSSYQDAECSLCSELFGTTSILTFGLYLGAWQSMELLEQRSEGDMDSNA